MRTINITTSSYSITTPSYSITTHSKELRFLLLFNDQKHQTSELNKFINLSSDSSMRKIQYSTAKYSSSVRTNNLTSKHFIESTEIASWQNEPRVTYWLTNGKTAGINLSTVLAQKNPKKYLVYVCHENCGGWGDRLRGIMSVFMMSLMLDRNFQIEITHPCNLTRILKPNFYNWLQPLNLIRRNNLTRKRYKLTRKMIITSANAKEFFLKNVSRIIRNSTIDEIWPEDVLYIATNKNYYYEMSENVRYRKKFKTYGILTKYNIKLETLFPLFYELLFQPVERVKNQIEKYTKMRLNKTLICAQMRTGQNPTLSNDKILPGRQNITETIFNFIDDYIKTNLSHNKMIDYRIFITTDSDSVKTEAKVRYSDHLIYTQGAITHLDRSDTDQACREQDKLLTDFHLLGDCDLSIISNSGFGIWGNLRRYEPYKDLYMFCGGKIYPIKSLWHKYEMHKQNNFGQLC
ncbi:unnamed protein product [Didymodactylos carnosus]|uniref:Fucosyltransferase n=1 Tax=Didymodactylos carnosus TaxID=1234261 RepID=A0A813PIG6_9BILA|nr:unnamed protein product [Didymodactylos carnosus]CAF3535759.1 unnamed protein product [Didymodactylos carnosus]